MTNFEHIKLMTKEELAKFLYDCTYETFTEKFCKALCNNCAAISDEAINGHLTEYAYCEIHNKCRFVEDATITKEEFDNPALWWLNQEVENEN